MDTSHQAIVKSTLIEMDTSSKQKLFWKMMDLLIDTI